MLKLKTYYLVKLAEDEHKKPRFYESDEQIEYGDKVVCHQKNGDKVGYCVGHLTCSKETMRKLISQLSGTYPLVKCETYKEKEKDIFVMMGICEEGQSPIDLLNKAIDELKEGNK